ncbi:MAG TPA: hypothetical protein VN791_00510 [Acidimicrobiales bacterium]|nr:hypothetical protein [Acidimicrobiales bacterium]
MASQGSTGSGDVCIHVIGMHRSGTSATAGLLGQLGLGMPVDDDLVPATADNERGHWESQSIVRLNNQLFRHFGGLLFSPPDLADGWQDDPSLDDLRSEASRRFRASFGPRPIAWKDPRACITLPFWQTVIDPPVAAVFVFRDPVEVARSLRARSGLPVVHGLATWERYVRAAARNLQGIPTLAADFDTVLRDPVAWCDSLVRFLGDQQVDVEPERRAAAVSFLNGDLRHHHGAAEADPGPAAGARLVFDELRRRQGPHAAWQRPDLGPEPEWVDDVLTLARELETVRIAHASLRRSRGVRVVTGFWKMRSALTRRPSP